MQVEQLQVLRQRAEREYEAYKEALKRPHLEHEQYLRDMQSVYGHMKHGRKIIDLWTSLTKAGLNKEGNPTLAICRADSKNVRFVKQNNGAGRFYRENDKPRYSWSDRWKEDVLLPEKTFPEWPLDPTATWRKLREIIETSVPVIPAKFLLPLRGALHNYHILWEVKEWKPSPPKDPMLLKQLTPNLWVVLATWNLTRLEQAVIRGRIP